ncbi:hypothetical protein CR513_32155, partial [Mucuna pruriens]
MVTLTKRFIWGSLKTVSNDYKSMLCKLKKFIYIITSYGFKTNVVDDCVYHKFSGSKYIFLVLYVDDILLTSSDISLLHETKRFLTKNFEMKNLGKASFVLGIQILRDLSQGILRLSQENYINKKVNQETPLQLRETNLVSSSAPTMTLNETRCKRFLVHQWWGV